MEIKKEIVVFGGGCFWCTEAVFRMFPGVISVVSGYSGGGISNPTYEQVSQGDTGHAEVIKIEYNASVLSFQNLLTIFFASHDATTLNKQGDDIGTQYRSVIFYTNNQQKSEATEFISSINKSTSEGAPVVTQVEALTMFYPAEDYHKNYYERNVGQTYCQLVISPKLAKVQKEFAVLLNSHR